MRIAAPVPLLLVLACTTDPADTTGTSDGPTSADTSASTQASDTPTGDPATSDGPTTSSPTTAGPTSDGPTTVDPTTAATTEDPSTTSTTDTTSTTTTTDTTTGLTATTTDPATTDPGMCSPGAETECYTGPDGTEGQGLCNSGVSTCDDRHTWGPCIGEVLPAAETCETPGDEDCDGADPCMGNGAYKWHKFWGAGSDERGVRIGFDATGALILAAQGASTSDFGGGPLVSAGSWDLYLAKFSPDGAHLWSKRFGDSSPQFGDGWALAVDPGGEFVIAGGYQGNIDLGGGVLHGQSIADIFFARFTGDGAHVWSKTFKAGSYAMPEGLGIDADGEVYLAGYFTGSLDLGGGTLNAVGVGKDAFVSKFSAAGAHVWSTRFGDNSDQYVQGLVVDPAGNTTIAGHFSGTMNPGNGVLVSAGSDDVFLAQFSPIGNNVWAKRYGDAAFQQVYGVARSANGRVTVTGRIGGTTDFGGGPLVPQNNNGFAAQFEANGAHVWSHLLGAGQAQPQGIAVDGLGSLVITGWFTGQNDFGGGPLMSEGDHDVFALKLTPAGAHVWSQRFGDVAAQDALGVAADATGNVAITGGFYGGINFGGGPSNTKGAFDGFLAVFTP